jgi:predicted PurR-regulated permease PerM
MSSGEPTRTRIEAGIGIAGLALLIFGCLWVLLPFISAATWAAILCFTTWPLFLRLRASLGGRRTLAALIATLLLATIIVAPVAFLVSTLSENVTDVIAASQRLIKEGPPAPPSWIASVPLVGSRLATWWTLMNESSSARVAELAKWLPTVQRVVLGSGRALGAGVFQIVLSLLLAFLFYRDGEAAARRTAFVIERISGDRGGLLLDTAGTTVRAVVYGVLGTAFLQGILAGIGFIIAGVPGSALLGFLTFVLAVAPGGPLLAGAPGIIWLYHRGETSAAIALGIWIVVVGNLDNVIRPLLISRGGATTPLILIILGIFGGAMAFGLIGLFLGPTLLAVGFSLFEGWSSTAAVETTR